jgi:site-specific DNA recombinase
MKTVIYSRYSSDQQKPASIDDQNRVCLNYAKQHNFTVTHYFSDAAISGASMNRPGIQELMSIAHQFDVVLCESLDRLSRDQSDIAYIHKRLAFQNVRIVTLDDGETTPMHIGLKGTMGAIQLQQISDKTHRGLRGRVEKGKSAGGKSYGYDVVRAFDSVGNPITGDIKINNLESKVVIRIFQDYAYKDKSAKTIANELNEEGILSPSGGEWGFSTICGNRTRETGILNNQLYAGRRVWNKLKYIKHPDTGKKQSRLNPKSEWIINEVPEFRIVSEELWDAVKAKQSAFSTHNSENKPRMRARYLLSNLFKCESCGGGVSMVNSKRYGCSRARNSGTCTNRRTVTRVSVEAAALNAIKSELLQDNIIEVVIGEYNRHITQLWNENQTSVTSNKSVVAKLEKEKANLINSIKSGVQAEFIAEELNKLSEQLKAASFKPNKQKPKLVENTGVASTFRHYLKNLVTDRMSQEATVAMRNLVDELILKTNGDADLLLNPYGLIEKSPVNSGESIRLVAGAGFEPTTFGL